MRVAIIQSNYIPWKGYFDIIRDVDTFVFLDDVQFTVRVDATPGVPFTLEAATNLNAPNSWSPLLTTNVPAMPFDYPARRDGHAERSHELDRDRHAGSH